ncbi:MAG: putative quinol monooxygenase [Tepidisphaeraceae bacterium]
MSKIYVIARFVAKPGCEEALKQALVGMLAPTHAEPGEKVYDLYQSDDPRRFYFVEEWADQAAFDYHASTPHFKALGPVVEPLLEVPVELNFTSPLNG